MMIKLLLAAVGIKVIAVLIGSIVENDWHMVHPAAICIGAPLLFQEIGIALPRHVVLYAVVSYFVLVRINQKVLESATKEGRFTRVCLAVPGWFFLGLLITVFLKGLVAQSFPGFSYGIPAGCICATVYLPYIISRFNREDREKAAWEKAMEEDRIRREKMREEQARREQERREAERREAERREEARREEARREEARREEERRRASNNRSKREQKRQQRQNTTPGRDNDKLVYFRGCHDKPSVKTLYRKLSKRYHPDNRNGDAEKFKAMQAEYNEVMKKYA